MLTGLPPESSIGLLRPLSNDFGLCWLERRANGGKGGCLALVGLSGSYAWSGNDVPVLVVGESDGPGTGGGGRGLLRSVGVRARKGDDSLLPLVQVVEFTGEPSV